MFSKKVTDSDAFYSMSSSAQALYFHLCQSADDDGFNNQIQIAMFKAHASIDDLKVLMAKNFVIRFENGVIVIKHWRLHNTLRKDRYTPTNFQEELAFLDIKDNGSYTIKEEQKCNWLPIGCQLVATDKNSIDKNSIDKNSNTPFIPLEGEKNTKDKITKVDYVQMIKDRNFDIQLEEVIIEWLTYKTEKRQSYKPTGFKSLLTEIENNAKKYGCDAVIDVTRKSMSSNWTGICWDKLKSIKPIEQTRNKEEKKVEVVEEDIAPIDKIPKELADELRERGCVEDDGSIWYSMLTEDELSEVRKYGLCL